MTVRFCPTFGIQSQVDEDDAARRFVVRQSHREQWLGQLDGGNGNDGEAPIPDADKDELRGVGDKDEVHLAHQWRVGCC